MRQELIEHGFAVRLKQFGNEVLGLDLEQPSHDKVIIPCFFTFKNHRAGLFCLMEKFILAIDQGTTGTTVCVLNKAAKILASVNHEHPQIFPQPGWVEHDPEAIWKTVTDG